MICPNCHEQIPDGIRYCPNCGMILKSEKQTQDDDPFELYGKEEQTSYEEKRKIEEKVNFKRDYKDDYVMYRQVPETKSKMPFFIISVLMAMILVLIISLFVLIMKSKDEMVPMLSTTGKSLENDEGLNEDVEETETTEEAEKITNSEEEAENDFISEFGIDVNENYEDNFYVIDSTDDFNTVEFAGYQVGYPKEFFYTGTVEEDYMKLSGKDGSELIYEKYGEEGRSAEENYDDFYNKMVNQYEKHDDIIVENREEGRLVISCEKEVNGVTYEAYNLLNTVNGYSYTMQFLHPKYGDDEGHLKQCYAVDCLYRYCGFNGSTNPEKHNPRSYDDFVASGEY